MQPEGFDDLIEVGRSFYRSSDPSRTPHIHQDFEQWVEEVSRWLDGLFPNTGLSAEWSSLPHSNLSMGGYSFSDPESWVAFHKIIEHRISWLARLTNSVQLVNAKKIDQSSNLFLNNKVFVVHGHNREILESVARFLEQIDLEPVILHEQPNEGRTIIEKFIDYSDTQYAIVLLSDDDRGGIVGKPFKEQKLRPRQNVLLELGFFIGKLGRSKVCALYVEGVEIPSDYQGVLYIKYDVDGAWKLSLAKEMKVAGLIFDMNKVVE